MSDQDSDLNDTSEMDQISLFDLMHETLLEMPYDSTFEDETMDVKSEISNEIMTFQAQTPTSTTIFPDQNSESGTFKRSQTYIVKMSNDSISSPQTPRPVISINTANSESFTQEQIIANISSIVEELEYSVETLDFSELPSLIFDLKKNRDALEENRTKVIELMEKL